MAEEKGKWVTIRGRAVFIPDGKTLNEVMGEKSSGASTSSGSKKSPAVRNTKEVNNYLDEALDNEELSKETYDIAKGISWGNQTFEDVAAFLEEFSEASFFKEIVSVRSSEDGFKVKLKDGTRRVLEF